MCYLSKLVHLAHHKAKTRNSDKTVTDQIRVRRTGRRAGRGRRSVTTRRAHWQSRRRIVWLKRYDFKDDLKDVSAFDDLTFQDGDWVSSR